jgi:methionyl aminopeptidase
VIELRTPAEIEQMKPAGRFVAEVLTRLAEAADVGVNLLELDELAHQMIKDRGAESCYIDYHPSFGASPFGKVLCTSVNDAVLHGLPHDYELRDGDLLSVDFAAAVDGWVADSAISVVVGAERPEDRRLIDTTQEALAAGIEARTKVQFGIRPPPAPPGPAPKD